MKSIQAWTHTPAGNNLKPSRTNRQHYILSDYRFGTVKGQTPNLDWNDKKAPTTRMKQHRFIASNQVWGKERVIDLEWTKTTVRLRTSDTWTSSSTTIINNNNKRSPNPLAHTGATDRHTNRVLAIRLDTGILHSVPKTGHVDVYTWQATINTPSPNPHK